MCNIKQPADIISRDYDDKLCIKWSPAFAKDRSMAIADAQKALDSNCLRLMTPYMPFRTGALQRSAIRGTVIGSGKIEQNIPYAHYLYYGKVPKTGKNIKYNKTEHPLAGPFWFRRMVSDKKDILLQDVAKKLGGEAKLT